VSEGPRRNESRFYRYPMRRVVAVFDDDRSLDAALAGLRQVGADLSRMHVLSGAEGARLLDRTGKSHGLRARLLRLLQRSAYEGDVLDLHDQVLNNGGHVLYVPVRNEDQQTTATRILRDAGGRQLLYFRRWSVQQI
jgi:hypothetical protein